MDKYTYIANAHGEAIDDMYSSYKESPENVDVSWQRFFEGFEFSQTKFGSEDDPIVAGELNEKEIKVYALIQAYRSRAHIQAKTNPVRKRKERYAILELSDFGLSEADLDTEFEMGKELGIGRATLSKIVSSLKSVYEGGVGFEYMYIQHRLHKRISMN